MELTETARQLKEYVASLPIVQRYQKPIYPKTQYKLGQELYEVCVDEDGKCSLQSHIVRSIRGGYVYAILKESFTWGNRAAIGKRFSKTLDFGWLDPIPSWCRTRCKCGEKFDYLHTTKRAAWADKTLLQFHEPNSEEYKRAAKSIKTTLSRLKKK